MSDRIQDAYPIAEQPRDPVSDFPAGWYIGHNGNDYYDGPFNHQEAAERRREQIVLEDAPSLHKIEPRILTLAELTGIRNNGFPAYRQVLDLLGHISALSAKIAELEGKLKPIDSADVTYALNALESDSDYPWQRAYARDLRSYFEQLIAENTQKHDAKVLADRKIAELEGDLQAKCENCDMAAASTRAGI